MRALIAATLLVALAVFGVQPARAAGDPGAIIRTSVDEAFDVLRDPELRKPDRRKDRIAKLRTVVDRVFDWDTMAQSSLGPAYRSITDAQRADFVGVFRELIADEYMDDLDRFIGDEKVLLVGAESRADQRVVKTVLVTHSRERVPIDYFMHEDARRGWIVHDFSIEGVSLVNHYRKSFSAFLANHTFEQLLLRLKARRPS